MTAKETSLEFVERMERTGPERRMDIPNLIYLSKTAALIEEHKTWVEPPRGAPRWRVIGDVPHHADDKDLHTAVRAVVGRIKEGK